LLAQGKRVLVTAHTPKALRVLRQKVVEPLQPLCISVLQNDKQSQEELQQSVRQMSVRLSQDDQLLERDAERLKRERQRVIGQLPQARSRLLDARQDEIRGVVFGGKDTRPIDAAIRRAQELRELWQGEKPSAEVSQRREDSRGSPNRRGGNALGQDGFQF
jgi:hypothetical protein